MDILNILVYAEGLRNPLGDNMSTIPGFVMGILSIVMYLGVPLIGVVLIYTGFKFLMARGNPEKIKSAKYNLLWVIIGVGVFLGAWALTVIIDSTINNILS
jgi:hypothetical protein